MPHDILSEARTALELERRHQRRTVPLHVLSVTPTADDVVAVEIMTDRPFEPRGWQGAEVLRLLTDDASEDERPFRATVLEADPDTQTLYVALPPGGEQPTPGPCRLLPFDFLRAPWALLEQPRFEALRHTLIERMHLASGHTQPTRCTAPLHVNPALHWNWSVVWGPPGTGKTYTLVRQAAALLGDPHERVLLVSNTNRVTDEIALALGEVLRTRGRLHGAVRLGRVRHPRRFRDAGLGSMLPWQGDLDAIIALSEEVAAASTPAQRAQTIRALNDARGELPTLSQRLFEDDRIVVTTLHAALSAVVCESAADPPPDAWPPFTTVILDEASLVGRLQTAVVSLLASTRVVLVGDPRQLSPIATAARSMPRQVMQWLARSGLDRDGTLHGDHVHRLIEQYRMHPDVRAVVSRYAYDDTLRDAPARASASWEIDGDLARLPRATWYVLDEHTARSPSLASQPGPGGRSRERPLVDEILSALFARHPELAQTPGLFLSPYVAQCTRVNAWLADHGIGGWRASTVHAQQGAEAEVVIFDVVHASSTTWPVSEWRRLINVGLSRAREVVVLLASRAEMAQVWLRPLTETLTPRVLRAKGPVWRWQTVDTLATRRPGLFAPARSGKTEASIPLPAEPRTRAASSATLGAQIADRKQMRPLLSHEQARLVNRDLHDAGPRLVRGVAGSGKTLVLARWVVRVLQGMYVPHVAVVYANAAMRPLLESMIDDAWHAQRVAPAGHWSERVHLQHLRELLHDLLRDAACPPPGHAGDRDAYDYEHQAHRLLQAGQVSPRFPALFVDEAQDFGHDALALMVQLTEQGPDGRRPLMVFYDNCQDLYRRGMPRWSELGLDLRGRSDVMRESFRSTRPNTELALEVLDRLRPLRESPDLRELMKTRPGGGPPWLARSHGRWHAHFCAADGQAPVVRLCDTREDEIALVVRQVRKWILDDAVDPGDIRILAMSKVRHAITEALRDALQPHGVSVWQRTSKGFADCQEAVVITTPHSFKGHDAELVVVAGVDSFIARDQPLSAAIYVAMTRARTLLLVTGTRAKAGTPAAAVVQAVEEADAVSSEPNPGMVSIQPEGA